jgi:hypothetical protein
VLWTLRLLSDCTQIKLSLADICKRLSVRVNLYLEPVYCVTSLM